MLVQFLIVWLLCFVAFITCHVPGDTPSILRSAAAGALVAIAICFVPMVVR